MSPLRNAITLLVIAATVAAVGACSATRRQTPADTLVVLFDGPITTADPRFAKNNYDSKLSRLIVVRDLGERETTVRFLDLRELSMVLR